MTVKEILDLPFAQDLDTIIVIKNNCGTVETRTFAGDKSLHEYDSKEVEGFHWYEKWGHNDRPTVSIYLK